MTEKKKGFLSRLGFKSKDDKLAQEAAERALAQQKVDADMAARMAAINAAALKSARAMDEGVDEGALSAEEQAKIDAQIALQAEIQAAKDVARARQLAEERARNEERAKQEAERIAARALEEKARAEEKAKLDAAAAAQRAAQQKVREEEEARIRAQEALALDKALRAEGEREAQRLAEKQASDAAARAKAEQERAAQDARAQEAKAQQEAASELARLEAEREAQAKAKAAELAAEAAEAERRAAIAERRAVIEAEERAEAERLAREKAKLAPPTRLPTDAADPLSDPLSGGGFFARITKGLSKSTSRMSDSVSAVFTKRKLDDDALEELEELLIASDLGTGPAMRVSALLSKDKFDKQITDMEIKIALADVISEILTPLEKPLRLTGAKPEIMLFVGVNGSGKTTTLGKMAKRYTDRGKKVMLCAGDTFRAAATEQLTIWGERAGAPVISGKPGADAAGLVYDAIERARKDDVDILMIDTAGRLQNRIELMDELSKVVRVIKKQDVSAPHHSILVLDATVGQNAILQTEAFLATAGVTGLIMTKLDGTAKGGVLVALSDKFGLPIHAIGIGERVEDLENFSAPVFAAALSGVASAMREG